MRFDNELPIKKKACREALQIREKKIINGINEAIASGNFFYTASYVFLTDALLEKLKAYGYKVEEKIGFTRNRFYTISWLPDEEEERK